MKFFRRKIIAAFSIIAAAALLLCGCSEDLFTTKEYKTCRDFAEEHRAGMEKQEVFDSLGCPRGYYDTENEYHKLAYTTSQLEEHKDEILAKDEAVWVYEFWKYSDPASPYRLMITFDSEGKSVSAELVEVKGG